MNRIVPWQIAMVLVTIGTYVAVLACGGSEQAAVAAAFVAAAFVVVAALVAAVAIVAVDAIAAAVAAYATALVAATTVIAAAVAAYATAAIAAVVVTAAAAIVIAVADVAAEDLGVQRRWTFTVCGIGAGAIFSALTTALITGSAGWSVAIGAIGIPALRVVWKLGPKAVSAATAPALATNGG